jgi:hypothetical protein
VGRGRVAEPLESPGKSLFLEEQGLLEGLGYKGELGAHGFQDLLLSRGLELEVRKPRQELDYTSRRFCQTELLAQDPVQTYPWITDRPDDNEC